LCVRLGFIYIYVYIYIGVADRQSIGTSILEVVVVR
jgi:hypothetical protein